MNDDLVWIGNGVAVHRATVENMVSRGARSFVVDHKIELTIEEARKAKRELEVSLADLLNAYGEKTGIFIESISVKHMETYAGVVAHIVSVETDI